MSPKVLADPRNAEENSRVWSGLFIVLAGVAALAGFLRTFCFSVCGEALTARLRGLSFKAIMRQVENKMMILVCSTNNNDYCVIGYWMV